MNVKRNWLLGLAVLVGICVGAGCQTSHPTRLNQPLPSTGRNSGYGIEWTPAVALGIDLAGFENRDLAKMTQRQLKTAASVVGVKFLDGREPVDDADLVVRVVAVEKPNATVSKVAVFSDASVLYEIECRDREDVLLTTTSVAGYGHCSESGPAFVAGLILMGPTMELSMDVERRLLKSGALKVAVRDAMTKVMNMASDSDWARTTLIADMRDAQPHEITNRGAEFFTKGDYRRAHLYLAYTCRRYPSYQPAYCYLGACLAQLGQRDEASQILQKAISLAPSTQEAAQAEEWIDSLIRR